MKTDMLVVLASVALLMTSCFTTEQITYTYYVDYSQLHKNGIFVTESPDVDFPYTPLGSIVSVTQGERTQVGDIVSRDYVDTDKALDEIAGKLREMGADGLINMKITPSRSGSLYRLVLTGMAIKRLGDDPDRQE